MLRHKNPNLSILEAAVRQLGPLADDMVFLGGCATGLLLTDAAAPPVRITQDVDAIIEVASLVEYYRLSEGLRGRGFKEDSGFDTPVCRWLTARVILDVMPRLSGTLPLFFLGVYLPRNCRILWAVHCNGGSGYPRANVTIREQTPHCSFQS